MAEACDIAFRKLFARVVGENPRGYLDLAA
jgi:hypothetical protein